MFGRISHECFSYSHSPPLGPRTPGCRYHSVSARRQQTVITPSSSTQETNGTTESNPSSWQSARKITNPLLRIQATWAAIEEPDPQDLEALFRQALEDEDHESLAMLGETWIARDSTHFINTLTDVVIRGSSPEIVKIQMDRPLRKWMHADPKKAFQALLKLDHQSQLILGRSLAGDLLLAYLAKDPAVVADLELKAFASLLSNRFTTSVKFTGDVEALAHGLTQRSLDSRHTRDLLRFLQHSIHVYFPTEDSNQLYATWWRALPEAMQLLTIPTNASREILNHPGLQKRLARLAMEDVSQVALYMAHYGKDWAAENPQEALEWVLERYRNQILAGPQWPLTPHPSTLRLVFNGDTFGQEGDRFYDAVSIPIRAIAANDPQQAIAALEARPYPHTRSLIAPMIAQEWAKSDRDAALAWSDNLPGKYARQRARALITEDTGEFQTDVFGF